MENGSLVNEGKIKAEDVISKLKDDGDFDKLRLKIIRKLKENEELRNSIMSIIKESVALNRPGVENMKPRQLSDAIHQEVGDKVMSEISDGVWKIIRSGDGMKTEITETVQSVYRELLNPKANEDGDSSSRIDLQPVHKELDNNGYSAPSASGIDCALSDGEPNEPPGFASSDLHKNNRINHEDPPKEELVLRGGLGREDSMGETYQSQDSVEPDNNDTSAPPGFSAVLEPRKPSDDSDEDPDVPPGFG